MHSDVTPLLNWLRRAEPEQRERMARLANTSVAYLYQIATCKRQNPSAAIALAIEDATKVLKPEGLPVVTVRQLATMCAVKGMPT